MIFLFTIVTREFAYVIELLTSLFTFTPNLFSSISYIPFISENPLKKTRHVHEINSRNYYQHVKTITKTARPSVTNLVTSTQTTQHINKTLWCPETKEIVHFITHQQHTVMSSNQRRSSSYNTVAALTSARFWSLS